MLFHIEHDQSFPPQNVPFGILTDFNLAIKSQRLKKEHLTLPPLLG